MKKPSTIPTLVVASLALAWGSASLQAQATYYDSVDFAQYTLTYPTAVPNLFVTSSGGPLLAGTADGTTEWRYRNTGPGVPSWNGNSYQISYSEGDVAGYQTFTGLTPNQQYHVAIYGVYPYASSARRGLQVSLDGGSTFLMVDNKGANGINWVDNSTPLGAAITPVSGDTRFWSWLSGTTAADASGNLNLYVQIPATLSDGEANDRFILDGFALDVVPEPTTFALAGLGMAALLVFRRRR